MSLTMTRPALLPFRWVGHGIDLHVYVDGDQMLFAAPDVQKAIGFHVTDFYDAFWDEHSQVYPLPTVKLEGLAEDLFTVDQVRGLALMEPMFLDPLGPTRDFMEWFDGLVAQLSGPKLEEVAEAARPRTELVDASQSFSVARAARLLSRDPVIDLGEKSLFATLQQLGWIDRDRTYTWVPGREPLAAGLLVRRQVRIAGPRKTLYPQVRITPEGMAALHKQLGGIAALTLDDPEHLTLVEIS